MAKKIINYTTAQINERLGKAGTALQDAPKDGNQYVRKDGRWAKSEGGDGGYDDNFVIGEDVYIGGAYIGEDGESLHMPTAAYDESSESIIIE